MEFIQLTPQLCDLIKSFRIRNEKTAKDICIAIGKTPSYLSKIESGSTKKIDVSVFIEFCNAVSNSSVGVKRFIQFAFQDETDYTDDTFLALTNIDDVIYEFVPPKDLITYIKTKMTSNNISIIDLVNELNSNKDLSDIEISNYNSLPNNIFVFVDEEKNRFAIKLNYNTDTIKKILENSEKTNHVTLEAILYSLYKLCGIQSDKAHIKAINTLENRFKVSSIRKIKTISISSKEDEEKYLGKLEPNVENNYRSVIQGIRLALLLSQSKGGSERIQTMDKNLQQNLGFSFSFMSTDLEKIMPLSKDLKRDFLKDLNKLIEEYSSKTDENIDFFFEE